MEYQILYYNDNGTAKVRMTIGDNILEQDFATANLDENVKLGMAIFKSELDRNGIAAPADEELIGKTTRVTDLPAIPLADLEPEQPTEPESE